MVLHTEADLASENVVHKGVVMSTIRKGRTLRPAPTQNSSSKSVLTSHEDCTQPRPTPLLSRCAGFVLCVFLLFWLRRFRLPAVLPCWFLRREYEGSPGLLVVLI